MHEVEYYAAYFRGLFPTAEAAFASTGMSAAKIALVIANAQINRSPGIFYPLGQDYGPLVLEAVEGYQLWAAFYAYRGTRKYADGIIKKFRRNGVRGTWAVMEWNPPLSEAAH